MTPQAKPAGGAGGFSIEILRYKEVTRATLQGFVSFTIHPLGLTIFDCPLHERDRDRWISFPGRPYEKADGTSGYQAFAEISREHRPSFQSKVLAALDEWRSRVSA